MMSAQWPRVAFWGKNVASHYSTLTERFRELGVPAMRFGPTAGARRYRGLPDSRTRRGLDLLVRAADKSVFSLAGLPLGIGRWLTAPIRWLGAVTRSLENWLDVAHLARRFDVIVFGFGKTATDTGLELWLYRALGRRIVFVFHGSDARPPYLDAIRVPPGKDPDWAALRHATRRLRHRIERVERYAHAILAYPSITHFMTRTIVDWYLLEKPLSLPEATLRLATPDGGSRERFRIGHAPSHRGGKGTPQLVAAVAALREEGFGVELVMPDGFEPKEDVLALLGTCDLTVDQVWADVPGATLAAEVASLGWRVLVGAREREFLESRYRERCEVIRLFDPEDLVSVLRQELRAISEGAALTKRFGSPLPEVAQRHLDAMLGSPDPASPFDPSGMPGVFGFGPERHLQETTAGYIERFGTSALELDHKPWLRDRILTWCSQIPNEPTVESSDA